jgi:hypothetical protein
MPISPTLNPSDFKHVQNIASALSCISIVGASVALALIIKWKNTFPARLPAYFCAVTLGLCIALFLGTLDIDICYAQGMFFFSWIDIYFDVKN